MAAGTPSLSAARVAVYARYSSDRQSETSIEDQVERCRRFVADRGGRVDELLVFADHAVSGASLERPGIEALLRAVAERRVDVVVTEDLSRVSRRQADAHALLDRLSYAGVALLGVADAIDTSQRSSRLLFSVRSMLADAYLEDLRDKTLRGLEARARAGLATGGLPYGYRSRPRPGAGHEIEIDPERADVVRWIFASYVAGKSQAAIASELNREAIPPPRAHSTRRQPGWVASAVRAILRNERYAGVWSFGRRRWVKVPGTNTRRPQARAEGELVRLERPELALVDAETWRAAAGRFGAGVRPGAAAAARRRRGYLLSGLLRCDACGSLLVISGGGEGRRYYVCSGAKSRGTCAERGAIREQLVREGVLAELVDRFFSPARVDRMRELVAGVLGAAARASTADREQLAARLARTQDRIRTLVLMQADGDRSEHVAQLRRDLEAQARSDAAAIATSAERDRAVRLPSPAELLATAQDLAAAFAGADVDVGRERLRRAFRDGALRVARVEGGVELRGMVRPLTLLFETSTPPAGVSQRAALDVAGCGGVQPASSHVEVPFLVRLAA